VARSRVGAVASVLALVGVAACAPKTRTQDRVPPGGWDDSRDAAGVVPHVSTKPASSVASRAAEPPKDFALEVRELFRVVACSGSEPLPPRLDARTVDEHCEALAPKLAGYRTRYVGVAQPFLHDLQGPGLPTRVVYPFAGGDLVTALTTYPNATEITTLSLELAGDPRRLSTMSNASLRESLLKLRMELDELYFVDAYSKSETLKQTQRGEIPDELAFFLVGLAVHGYEPVSLRYFTVDGAGTLHYLSAGEIAELDGSVAERRKGSWIPPDFSEAFASSELVFQKAGVPDAPKLVHRHIAENLSNEGLSSGVVAHLNAKGDVVAMTKAASYLLWSDDFSIIRDFLVQHAVFMVSDSTGVPADIAAEHGLSQRTYGTFLRSLLGASAKHNVAMKKLWGSQPKRALPFRYGYQDGSRHDHLMVTERKLAGAAGG
jgi:hypothetical protein